jgi:hypothetical protein
MRARVSVIALTVVLAGCGPESERNGSHDSGLTNPQVCLDKADSGLVVCDGCNATTCPGGCCSPYEKDPKITFCRYPAYWLSELYCGIGGGACSKCPDSNQTCNPAGQCQVAKLDSSWWFDVIGVNAVTAPTRVDYICPGGGSGYWTPSSGGVGCLKTGTTLLGGSVQLLVNGYFSGTRTYTIKGVDFPDCGGSSCGTSPRIYIPINENGLVYIYAEITHP